jgi:hypothetical protein
LRGALSVSAVSDGFVVESYREVPLSLKIVLVNVILEPRGGTSEFELAFEDNTATARVLAGRVDIRATDVRGTLMTDWRAVLAPGEALQIIPPFTPTPEASLTPTSTSTPAGTPTATWTPTATGTQTQAPTRATTPTAAWTSTVIPPTDTPPDPGPRPTRVPTNTPVPPPPTNTPIPPPTNTPMPPPTDTPKPTPE